MNSGGSITISLLTSDSVLERELSQFVQRSRRLRWAGVFRETGTWVAALALRHPDALLVDLDLPGTSAISAVRRVKTVCPGVRVFVLSGRHDPERVLDAFKAGADGCYSKRESSRNIVKGIIESQNGGSPISADVARSIVAGFQKRGEGSSQAETLSARQQQIFQCLLTGLSYKQIGGALHIAETTVNDHLKHIYRKLNVHSRSEAVAKFRNAAAEF